MAGQILPEFFNKAGEPIEIPAAFVKVVKAAIRGQIALMAHTSTT